MTLARRVLGALLVAAALLPLHRLLDPARGGPAAAATREIGDALAPMAGWGTVLSLAVAVVLALLVPAGALRRALRAARPRLRRPAPGTWAVAAGTVALAAGLAVALLVLRGTPTLLDEMVQLLHARGLASGRVALALPPPEAARVVQNGVITPAGWVSVYPPGHTVLLALGLAAGVPWVVGPVLLGVTAAASALAFLRLLPERPATARLAGAAVAASPFLAGLGGGFLSHTAAGALAALALLAALAARDGRAGWAAPAGLAMGALVATRPWTGLTLGAALTAGVWLAERRGGRWLSPRLALWIAGGLPVAVALGAWNARLFGHPLLLGYDTAFGPAHGLGLHRDPWGNLYGLREAVAYTGFDLAALGVHLLETPVPLVALVGAWLLVAPRLPRGSGVLLAWALVPVAANALYWHHGYHMGPRMLYEAAPAWLALGALAVTGLAGVDGGGADDPGDWGPGRVDRRRLGDVFLWLGLLMVPAALLLQAPARIASYAPPEAYLEASRPPAPADGEPAVVFVHGGWTGRVAARLVEAGMRRDSVETALRRNPLCRVHMYAQARLGGDPAFEGALPRLDLEPLPGMPAHLRMMETSPGAAVRVEPGAPLHPSCRREMAADRLGVVELAPLLWRTALPGEAGGVLLARDLGPEANRRFREGIPERRAWMWVPPGPGEAPALLPYEEAERMLWGEEGVSGPALSRR